MMDAATGLRAVQCPWPWWGRTAASLAATAMAMCANGASNAAADADFSATGPGSLVEAKLVSDIDESIRVLGATPVRVRYRSTLGSDGSPTVVSGVVFIPGGTPPAGGWPVLAHAHGTTGISSECGPSLFPNLLGGAPLIASFLKAGFAVAAADYQGLGEPGIHPYLDAKTAGLNVIDSVRALRRVWSGRISDRWLVIGHSQGGGVAWAADEQAATYATDLHLLGAVALMPAANVVGYVGKAVDGTLSAPQRAAYIAILKSLGRVHPELDLDLYRRGSVTANWEVLTICHGPRAHERADALVKVTADELKPATPDAARKLTALLTAMALPQQAARAPMLVVYAGQDTYVEPQWTRAAIKQACGMGSPIEAVFQPDKSHGDMDPATALQWVGHRLAGDTFQSTC